MSDFAYLHTHTEYSLTDGALKVEDYVDKLNELDVPRAAITDTHNLFGSVKFFQLANDAGIEPILGVDLHVKSGDETRWGIQSGGSRLLVYVENRAGYQRLSSLVSKSYKRRSDRGLYLTLKELADQPEGLRYLGPPGPGPENEATPTDSNESLKDRLDRFQSLFGDRAGIEFPVYEQLTPEQDQFLSTIKDHDLPVIITHPTYFLDETDYETIRLRRAIQTNTPLDDLAKFPDHRKKQFFASPDDLRDCLGTDHDDLLEQTLDWTQACEFDYRTGHVRLPDYPHSEGDSLELLKEKCYQKLDEKSVKTDQESARNRLKNELETIGNMGFEDYFLIVADIVNWARQNGVRVGPGRGSAAGSFVSYLMNITTVDPFRYDLIFERFLNPDRNEMPDIDVDFADHQRDRVLEYIRNRFGEEVVAHIITFGNMKARNSIRDVGRIRGEPQDRIDRLAESVPPQSDETLGSLIDQEGSLTQLANSDRSIRDWINQSRKVEGFVRNPSIHAAGILITEDQIDRSIPLYCDSGSSSMTASQFDMYDIQELGYLKLDILGLTTLTLIDRTLEQISEDERPNLHQLPEDDPETLNLFSSRKLEGVFQFEAMGGRRLAQEMAPKSKREVIDCIALNRPGPAQFRDEYLGRRSGDIPVEYPHEDLEEVLEDTYGLIIYQEQVMAIARIIGGFSWSQSDTMRKAMGKKKTELMANLREQFLRGADKNGYDEEFARELFDQLAQFAEYGFNRSHSAAYGEITYQTAYLKAHFTEGFYAAFLTLKSSDRDRIHSIAESMRNENIRLLPPTINDSEANFHVESRAVRYGLKAIKHVGGDLAETIEHERKKDPFQDLDDFLSRIEPNLLSVGGFKALAAGGCFDEITERSRGDMIKNAERIVSHGRKLYSEAESGQSTLFERGDQDRSRSDQRDVSWDPRRLRKAEKEALGVKFSE